MVTSGAEEPRRKLNRLATVRNMLMQTGYEWVTESFLRHAIFNAKDRVGSGGTVIPGNGLASAIIRIGRKVLIDLDRFDAWIEAQRETFLFVESMEAMRKMYGNSFADLLADKYNILKLSEGV